jgi:hypothetical protein
VCRKSVIMMTKCDLSREITRTWSVEAQTGVVSEHFQGRLPV